MPMFWMPLSGSFVMYCDSVVNGAMSQPGVEMGIGSESSPFPGLSSALPSVTISWHSASLTTRGSMGFAIALLQVAAHAEAVDLPAGGKRADHDRYVVLVPLAVGDVGEQERLPVPLLDAAAKLPADQRVHFRVLVDRALDRDQQACFPERFQVLVQVRIAA